MADWYYSADGVQQGPVSTEQLRQLAGSGMLDAQVLVWREGFDKWQPATQVPELAGMFHSGSAVSAAQPPYAAAQPSSATAQPAYREPAATLSYQGPSQGDIVSDRTIEMLVQTKPWVRLFSVLLYIGVAFMGLFALIQLVGGIGMAASGSRGAGPFAAIGAISGVATLLVCLLYFFPAMYLGRYASRIAALAQSRRQSDLEGALEAQKSFWKFIGILTLIVICVYVLVLVAALLLPALI